MSCQDVAFLYILYCKNSFLRHYFLEILYLTIINRNAITTNGHSMSFLFTQTVKRSLGTTKNPLDFIDDTRNGCDIWAVDPGITSIITALDSFGDNERQRIVSLDEYYHLCGYNDATFIRKKH